MDWRAASAPLYSTVLPDSATTPSPTLAGLRAVGVWVGRDSLHTAVQPLPQRASEEAVLRSRAGLCQCTPPMAVLRRQHGGCPASPHVAVLRPAASAPSLLPLLLLLPFFPSSPPPSVSWLHPTYPLLGHLDLATLFVAHYQLLKEAGFFGYKGQTR